MDSIPPSEFDRLLDELEEQLQTTGIVLETVTRIRNALKQSEERLRLFVEHAPAALAMFDLDMCYICVSRRWIEDYGLQGRDLRGMCHYDIFPEIPERWKEIHRRALAGEVVSAEEDAFERSDGSIQWLKWEVLPWRDPTGAIAGIVVFSEDITKRKVAEEELRGAKDALEARVNERTQELRHALQSLRAETQERIQAVQESRRKEQLLMQQNRQAAMGELIGNIAHQWRQPLNVLGLLVQEMEFDFKRGELTPAYLRSTVAKAMQTIQEMSKTIDAFRNYFKPDQETVTFEINDVVAATLALLEATLRAQKIEVQVTEDDRIPIHGYPHDFSHVILNLLLNAKDALLARHVREPQITIRIFREDGRPAVTITDNAGGIADDVMANIFDPYFSTRASEKGAGIGLFMSKTIIEKSMDGALTVRNTEKGAEFKISLP